MFRLLFIFVFITANTWAMPKKIEVWFLSIPNSSLLRPMLETKKFLPVARSLQCQQMGEYCFDPQVGLYKKGEEGALQEEVDTSQVETANKYDFMDPHKGAERSLIECDENPGFFDIFCGKAKKLSTKSDIKLEVWVDVSSTMKQVDFQSYDKACYREMFLDEIKRTCPLNQKMKVYSFEEYKSEVGSLDRVCLSGGLNDMKKLVKDIKKSKADHLILITDIFEAEEKFIFDIENMANSTIKGLNKPLYAKDLLKDVKRVKTLCK